jgi:hypothetical protein
MSTREFNLGSPRSKVPCIYTQGTYYLHVKAILHGMMNTLYDIQDQTIEASYLEGM